MIQNFKKFLIIYFVMALLSFFIFPQKTSAASLTSISDVMTRQKVSELSSHDITFTLGVSTALDAGETVAIDFGEDDSKFVVAGAATAVADLGFNDGAERTIVDVDGDCTGHSGANDIVAQVNDTTGVLTFTACGSFVSQGNNTTINVEYGTAAGGTNRVTNPAGADTDYIVDITAAGDTGKYAVYILTNEQVTVTGTVDPTITLSLTATSTAFGTLAPGVVDTADTNITLTIGTNANNGYTITVRDVGDTANPGLYAAATLSIIGSADATYGDTGDLSAINLGYGLQASCTAGCATNPNVAVRWRQGGDVVGGLEITDTDLVTYNTALTVDHTIQIVHKAKVSTFTPAGSYNDVLTYIATGNF